MVQHSEGNSGCGFEPPSEFRPRGKFDFVSNSIIDGAISKKSDLEGRIFSYIDRDTHGTFLKEGCFCDIPNSVGLENM